MGKIADALEKANGRPRDKGASAPPPSDPPPNDRKLKPVALISPKPNAPAPSHPSRPHDGKLITLTKPQSFESEQFKFLRTNLMFPVSGKPPRSIMVTSAVPGEGKSFVSANLAVSITQNIKEHVLLIDCDMRKPSQHQIFGFVGVKGLSNYLESNYSLSDLLLKTEVNKLTLLAGGPLPPNPAELLSSPRMSELLTDVQRRYADRYVVIDSPPPHLTSETSVIARQVDAILVVVKYGATPRKMVVELIERLGKDKIVGIVFNWFDMRVSTYKAYGRYGNYYGKS